MKKIFTTLGLIVAFCSVAQEYKISVGNNKSGKLVMNDIPVKGFIEGYAGNEIVFILENYRAVPEKAKNMKPVFARGVDNTGIGLNVEQKGNSVFVKGLMHSSSGRYRIKVPNQLMLEYKSTMWSDTVSVRNMKNGVDITTDNSIILRNIQGAILAKMTSGVLDIILSAANSSSDPVSLLSASGDIDITIPESLGVRFDLTTDGRVYSDFDWTKVMDKGRREANTISPRYIKGQMNGGGINLKATSSSGDIFIRKSD